MEFLDREKKGRGIKKVNLDKETYQMLTIFVRLIQTLRKDETLSEIKQENEFLQMNGYPNL